MPAQDRTSDAYPVPGNGMTLAAILESLEQAARNLGRASRGFDEDHPLGRLYVFPTLCLSMFAQNNTRVVR
jgi:hypothetical protein